LASLFGADSHYIFEIRRNMQSNIVGVAKDLEGSFRSMAGTLFQLLKGSDAEKQQARHDINNMRKDHAGNASEQDRIQIQQSVEQLMRKHAVNISHVEDGWHQIDKFLENSASYEDETSALLEVQSDSTRANLSVGLIVVIVVLLLLLMVLWLIPYFAAVFWGVLFPIIIALIVVIVVFLIVRFLFGLFRDRELSRNGNNRRSTTTTKGNSNKRRSTTTTKGRNRRYTTTTTTRNGRNAAQNGRGGAGAQGNARRATTTTTRRSNK